MLCFVRKRNAYANASLFALLLLSLCAAAEVRAEVRLPDVLSDSMVLQRGVRVPVWGTASPGEAVTVSFAGQTKKTAAGADGRWRVWLDPLRANATPAVLTVNGKDRAEVKAAAARDVAGDDARVGQRLLRRGLLLRRRVAEGAGRPRRRHQLLLRRLAGRGLDAGRVPGRRSEEHTSE